MEDSWERDYLAERAYSRELEAEIDELYQTIEALQDELAAYQRQEKRDLMIDSRSW